MTKMETATSEVGRKCPACHQPLDVGLQDWHLACKHCTYEGSTLSVDIDTHGITAVVDEAMREEGLGHLRQRNFEILEADLVCRVRAARGGRPTLLDVGCAHGWFLEAGRDDFVGTGIEPDARVADAAEKRGLPVRRGFFPDVLASHECFDVIVFNDVLEHIPDISAALEACVRHLEPGGWVVVNAPSRTGVLYRTSRIMARLGMPATFDRMWQKGFPSPHVHYLDDRSMEAIAGHAGMRVAAARTLPSISTHGLYARIRTDRNVSPIKAALVAATLTAASPAMKLLPPDIKVWLLQVKR